MAKSSGKKRGSSKPRTTTPAHISQWANDQLLTLPANIGTWGSVATNAYIALREELRLHCPPYKQRPSRVAVLHIRMHAVLTDAQKATALLFANQRTLAHQCISAAKANSHLNPETLSVLRTLDVEKSAIAKVLKGELL